MVFSELSPGTEFFFGGYTERYYDYRLRRTEERNVDLKWIKTSDNQLSVCTGSPFSICFDYPHNITGTNEYMRRHGHRLFTESALMKYLNCADRSWSETGSDGPMYHGDRNGFLDYFTEEDRKMIIPHHIKVSCPAGYTKKFGPYVEKTTLVSIPSIDQLGTGIQEGKFAINNFPFSTWVTDANSMNLYYRRGYAGKVGGNHYKAVAPVIRIKDDAPVDLINGKYYIRVPETEFSGNLDALLGWDTNSAA